MHDYVISREDIARDLGALNLHNSSTGALQVKLKLHAKVRLKVWFCKSLNFKMRFECDNVNVDIQQNNSFDRTTCSVHI